MLLYHWFLEKLLSKTKNILNISTNLVTIKRSCVTSLLKTNFLIAITKLNTRKKSAVFSFAPFLAIQPGSQVSEPGNSLQHGAIVIFAKRDNLLSLWVSLLGCVNYYVQWVDNITSFRLNTPHWVLRWFQEMSDLWARSLCISVWQNIIMAINSLRQGSYFSSFYNCGRIWLKFLQLPPSECSFYRRLHRITSVSTETMMMNGKHNRHRYMMDIGKEYCSLIIG